MPLSMVLMTVMSAGKDNNQTSIYYSHCSCSYIYTIHRTFIASYVCMHAILENIASYITI